MKNLMALLTQPKVQTGFDQRQMEHLAHNPVHEAHLQKAFTLKEPKLKMHAPHADKNPGSPWLNMMGEKK